MPLCYIRRSSRDDACVDGSPSFGFFPKISTTVENIVENPVLNLNHVISSNIQADFRPEMPILHGSRSHSRVCLRGTQ